MQTNVLLRFGFHINFVLQVAITVASPGLRRLKGVIKNTVLFASVVTDTQLLIASHKAVPLNIRLFPNMTRLPFQGNTGKN